MLKNLKLSCSKLKQLFCVRYTQDINDYLAAEHCYVLNNEEPTFFFFDFQEKKITNETVSTVSTFQLKQNEMRYYSAL